MKQNKKNKKKWIYIIFLFIIFKIFYDVISNPDKSIERFKRGYEYVIQMVR